MRRLTKVGEKRLRAVRAHILEEPRRLNMALFRLDRKDKSKEAGVAC